MDLVLDRSANTVQAGVLIAGSEFLTPSLALTALLPADTIAIFGADAGAQNFRPPALGFVDFGPGDRLQVDNTQLSLFVPEPGTGVLLGLGLGILASRARRRTSSR